MPAGKHNITIEKGATFNLVLTWKDENNVAINLTGYSARMKVKRKVTDTTSLLDLTTTNSKISLGGSAGTITITATDEETGAISASGNAVYDLELESASGAVTRLLEGTCMLSASVTT